MLLRRLGLSLAIGLIFVAVMGAAQASDATLLAPVTPFVIDVDLRDLPQPREWQPGDPVFEVPKRSFPPPGFRVPVILDERRECVNTARAPGAAKSRASAH